MLATTIDERLLKPVRGDQSQDSNLLARISACHVLPPAFASPILYKADKETTETFIVTGYVVPAGIRPPTISPAPILDEIRPSQTSLGQHRPRGGS